MSASSAEAARLSVIAFASCRLRIYVNESVSAAANKRSESEGKQMDL